MVFQNNVLSGAAGSGTTAYEIDQSIRFNPADSAYMSRTPSGSSSSRKKWTFSGWFKRGNITPSSSSRFFNVHSDSNNFFISQFQSDDSFNVTAREGGSEVLKYEPGGHYKFHTDHNMKIPRSFSCIFLVNDNYKGGELCFRYPQSDKITTIEKKENRMIIWPSNFLYPHCVKPVTEGERYSVVAWAL